MGRRNRAARDARGDWGSLHPLFDLHGLTAEDARRRAEGWLRARRAEGARTVVLVTGRGNRSQGPPVLRGEIEHLLAGLEGSLVAGFALMEGGGGFRVELRRADPPPARTVAERRAEARVRDAAPALRLRAEEALWELGVAPTPALLEAEIQRILREDAGEGRTGEE